MSEDDWSSEETDDPIHADKRNFYMVEKLTKDGKQVDRHLYASNNFDKARDIFTKAVAHRPRIRLTIRQRTRVLQRWPIVAAGTLDHPLGAGAVTGAMRSSHST
jgi:hypothetical protein